jgi:hypothetical protein
MAGGPTEANHVVRKTDLDQAVAPLAASQHAALIATSTTSITFTMPSGTQSLTAALRLKSAGGLQVDADGAFVVFGTNAGQAVAGDVYTAGMAGKAALAHGHAIGDTSGLQVALDAKAPLVHSHAITDISLLRSELDAKAPVSSTWEISSVNGLTAALAGKAAAAHGHTIGDVTGLQTALDGKSDTTHTHAEATTVAAGFLSAADKVKLNSLSQNTYWLAPVATKADLPLNTGPVRACCLVADESRIYRCIATVGFVDDQWVSASTIAKRAFTIGDGVSAVIDIVHSLNTWDVVPAFQKISTREGLLADWQGLDENTIRVTFGAAPTMSGVRATIAG